MSSTTLRGLVCSAFKALPAAALVGGVTLWAPRLSLRAGPREPRPPDEQSYRGAAAKPHVRILSQNVWNSFFVGGPGRVARLRALRDFVRSWDVDVVVVQEMFCFGVGPLADAGEAGAFGEMMSELGLVHQTWPAASMPALGQNSGLAVYSRHPILSESHGAFRQRRAVSAKGWSEVVLQLPAPSRADAARLVLVNTHLEHAHSKRWQLVRQSQWGELAAMVGALCRLGGGHELVAVLGDFNVCAASPWQALPGDDAGRTEYEALLGAMVKAGLAADLFGSSGSVAAGGSAGGPTWTMREERFSPDHAFVTAPLYARVLRASVEETRGDGGMPVSDHLGLLVDISV